MMVAAIFIDGVHRSHARPVSSDWAGARPKYAMRGSAFTQGFIVSGFRPRLNDKWIGPRLPDHRSRAARADLIFDRGFWTAVENIDDERDGGKLVP